MTNLFLYPRFWCTRNILACALWPYSLLYRAIIALRYFCYRRHIKTATQFPVPVIVVGNITVGGTGKTPLIIWLVNYLRQHGFNPGIVSRGYGGKAQHYPLRVTAQDDPAIVSDEAILLVQQTECPLVIAPDRVAAVKQLLQDTGCDMVLSDDGLQHYAMARDIEIVVLDGERRLGNGFCLPAGPLREPAERLKTVNFIVTNGVAKAGEYSMQLVPGLLHRVAQPSVISEISQFKNQSIHAVAGIGNPDRFFNLLRQLNLNIIPHAFPDHHHYQPGELNYGKDAVIVMTEKDAVKCKAFANENYWYLRVQAEVDAAFGAQLLAAIKR